jgi:hypothetical protein
MAYRSYHCSATLLCSTCINVFLHTPLTLYVLLPFMLCAPCPFNAPFLFCAFRMLHSASFYVHKSLSIATTISSLFCVFILSVHLLHPPCIVPLHALQHATILLIELFTTTSIFLCFTRSRINTLSMFFMFYSCRALYLIIMAIPQLFWQLCPCVHTLCILMQI